MEGATVQSCDSDVFGTYVCTMTFEGGVRRVYWNPSIEVSVGLPTGASGFQRLGRDPRPAPAAGSSLSVGETPLLIDSSQ